MRAGGPNGDGEAAGAGECTRACDAPSQSWTCQRGARQSGLVAIESIRAETANPTRAIRPPCWDHFPPTARPAPLRPRALPAARLEFSHPPLPFSSGPARSSQPLRRQRPYVLAPFSWAQLEAHHTPPTLGCPRRDRAAAAVARLNGRCILRALVCLCARLRVVQWASGPHRSSRAVGHHRSGMSKRRGASMSAA